MGGQLTVSCRIWSFAQYPSNIWNVIRVFRSTRGFCVKKAKAFFLGSSWETMQFSIKLKGTAGIEIRNYYLNIDLNLWQPSAFRLLHILLYIFNKEKVSFFPASDSPKKSYRTRGKLMTKNKLVQEAHSSERVQPQLHHFSRDFHSFL